MTANPPNDPRTILQEKMRALTVQYVKQLKERAAELSDLHSLCENNTLSNDSRRRLRAQAHTLAGTGATYGFPAISKCGQALEQAIIDAPEAEARSYLPELEALMAACTTALESHAPDMAAASPPDAAPTADADAKLIVCVDDDPAILELLTHILETTGLYRVQTCRDGEGAIALLRDTIPHAILLDMAMPGMDGIELFQQLQKMPALAGTPIAFLTRETSEGKLERYRAVGAKGVIAKPVDVEALLYQVACLFGDDLPRHLTGSQ